MPTLRWVGKDKVINHHLDAPFQVSSKVSSFSVPKEVPTDLINDRCLISGVAAGSGV